MKLAKAIKITTAYIQEKGEPDYQDFLKALQLGIEALELILRVRAKGWSHLTDSLPSETED